MQRGHSFENCKLTSLLSHFPRPTAWGSIPSLEVPASPMTGFAGNDGCTVSATVFDCQQTGVLPVLPQLFFCLSYSSRRAFIAIRNRTETSFAFEDHEGQASRISALWVLGAYQHRAAELSRGHTPLFSSLRYYSPDRLVSNLYGLPKTPNSLRADRLEV